MLRIRKSSVLIGNAAFVNIFSSLKKCMAKHYSSIPCVLHICNFPVTTLIAQFVQNSIDGIQDLFLAFLLS